jgi:glycosyltransferase involved in cell wall biosynthesis
MKILHIIAGDLTGGAAKGAYCLHRGLIKSGIDSKVLTNSTITFGDKNVVSIITNKKSRVKNFIRRELDSFPVIFYRKREKIIFSTGFFGFDFTKTKEYKRADIIHLHWVNGGFINIKHLAKVKKPVIWTMRDMWPMTGGCHYFLNCKKYKTGCGKCEQLKSKRNLDLSRIIFNRKRKYLPENIKLVGISDWLSNEAKKSKLFKNFSVKTIWNNINTNNFFPIDKKDARKVLQINTDKNIILTGAKNLKDFYKGFDKFLESLNFLDKKKYILCFFGNLDSDIEKKLKFEYRNFGCLKGAVSLRQLYSAADVFVAPSTQEAFGKTLAEAMACGTPVVCFNATGPKDIVDHKINGYKAKPFDSKDLANGIEWVLNNNNYEELCRNARKKVVENFDVKVIAKKYIKLYKEVLDEC